MSEKTITITCVPCPGCGEDVTASRALTEPWQCARCNEHDRDRRAAWVAFCAAFAANAHLAQLDDFLTEEAADELLAEYDARFPKRRK